MRTNNATYQFVEEVYGPVYGSIAVRLTDGSLATWVDESAPIIGRAVHYYERHNGFFTQGYAKFQEFPDWDAICAECGSGFVAKNCDDTSCPTCYGEYMRTVRREQSAYGQLLDMAVQA